MNIAHVLPCSIRLPLLTHSGRYDWVLALAGLQIKMGHEVTIYCHPESKLEGITTKGIDHITDDVVLNNKNTFRLAFKNDHDIYHSHLDNLHYEVSSETTKPIVFTQHWWPTPKTIKLANDSKSINVWAVPPTEYMYNLDVELGVSTKGYIYHGIDTSTFTPQQYANKKRLLFVGRIAPEKNLPLAINVARSAGLGLDIIGKVPDKNIAYWKSVKPLIDGQEINYLGPKSHSELTQYYSNALALLFPSDTNEPFGLVAIESQLCGTPVLMYKGGSRGELIQEGVTGFLCKNKEDFVHAAKKCHQLSSADCVLFAKRFDILHMAEQYESLYKNLINY